MTEEPIKDFKDLDDASLLLKGEEYDTLNESFVIFICKTDVFKQGRPVYTFENRCIQDTDIALGDKTTRIFLNPQYKMECVSPELVNFLKFLTDGKAEGKAEGIVQTVKDMGGSLEIAAQQLLKQCGMDMEKALETAKLYW